ncbi:MAG: methyl-accepting chemotaxis protein, partial [Succinivibrio sp.]|nr:methyl-accepting chemotaxis protein [Succinivibrio sp.]
MFDKLSVKMKVVSGFTAVIVFTLIIGISAIFIMLNFNSAANEVHQTLNVRHTRIHNVVKAISNADNIVYEAVKEPQKASLTDLNNALEQLYTVTNALKGATDPQVSQNIKDSVAKIRQAVPTLLDAIKAGNSEGAEDIYNEYFYPNFTSATASADTITEKQIAHAGNVIESIASMVPVYATIVLLVLAVIVATGIAILVSNYTVRNLQTALKTATAIAQGDLNVAIDSKSQDEFGQLIRATEKMRSELYTLVGQIKTAVNRAVEDFDSIHSITEEISASAQSTENKAVTVAAASDEMVSTTGDIAKNCQSAATTSSQANATTEQGVNEVQDTIRSIQEQVRKTQVDAELIKALVDQSQKIGTIVQTIEDIASQT